jgi:hypothetical protein
MLHVSLLNKEQVVNIILLNFTFGFYTHLAVMRRAPGQTLVNLPMKIAFRDFIDGELEGLGYADRSKFIRDAIRDKLIHMGKTVPVEFTLAPGRAGKGGRKLFRSVALNEKTNSKADAARAKLLGGSAAKPVSYRRPASKKSATEKHPAPISNEAP